MGTRSRPDGAPVGGVLDEDTYRFAVGPSLHRLRLDAYLNEVFKGRSRSYWKKMVERGAVEVEGRPAKGSSRVGEGDRLVIRLALLGRGVRRPCAGQPSYELLYEDEALIAVNKRAGAFCHPVGRLHTASVVTDLRRDHGPEIRPCHRLDRFVSGLMVFARSRANAACMSLQFEGRDVSKTYLALVHGLVAADEGRIQMALGQATDSIIRIKMGVDELGKPSVTRYRVLQRYAEHTLVHLFPETGRRHQLRIHLAEIGHPIVNDPLYGEVIDVDYFERQTFDNHDDPDDARRWIALHSRSLSFDHPATGARMTLEAPLTGEFKALVEHEEARLRGGA